MATISISFCPYAMARPRVPQTRKPPVKKQTVRSPNPKPSHKLKARTGAKQLSSIGVEATTYTRLPPREDFSLPSLDSSSFEFSSEVKLSESNVALKVEKEIDNLSSEEEEEEEEEEEKGLDGNLGVNYSQFEVFEGTYDSELDEEDDDSDIEGFSDDKLESVYQNDDGELLGFKEGETVNLTDNEGKLEEGEVKEKGVPAVMRCFDRAKIFAKAGDGGNGVVAMRREKFVPLGGPSGGDGGRGGNVYMEVDGSMNSLLPFRNSVHFRAGRGDHGRGQSQNGAKGEDVVIKVAPGTVVREAGKEEVLLELLHPGQLALLLPGGRGGRGNASFKSGTNKVPRIAENGAEGPEMWLELELKLVADIGIVGAPNAGKSTLLSVISAAQPTIANYPFTTLLPNLGVVSFDYDSTMVVADLPGLLEGAHRGFGLGHEFLRHTERCSALIHVVDGSSQQPEFEFDAVRLELELFSPEIAEKPYLVAFNKMDLPDAYENWQSFKESLEARGIEVFCMSAVKREGTHEVSSAAYQLLRENKMAEDKLAEDPVNLNHVAEMVRKQQTASINEFEITHDSTTNTWHVVGSGLQRFVQMTNWRYVDSGRRFQHVLEACGVNKSLIKLGVKEGDTVIVGDMEMIWHDAADTSGFSNFRKGSTETTKWPQWK
ncbi:hypothetical protein PRUPE_1G139700 [Prunus persica]|uniref:Obg domain-containing protein n=1 Tax=Prunus persica TaxID=3760 RepID=M5XLH7_PRUPE|nr:GTP-binding protein OBGC, chloroplastic [Prunus persica]XP_020410136.1 GTP-binding protein OBGC, chloroplastic [Prunus persica]XP_020410137.1 GTP-binding protein OBGC, chloroplastic [Prunus persica]XP_020410138.1 GTP-binding protein OBGC, chloroplastic [Prunus persica]XP_020410140.1 GTP-binding protein OBGC, chloroplastic [Prunus persica]ONI28364.1 hypothetical protein PRUPE_1G139700 [Prunus persica]ONI28365.1 hypothetical protein PRUPE_1G139700 [Prunus persica]ONI28366.1 hypothetical pro